MSDSAISYMLYVGWYFCVHVCYAPTVDLRSFYACYVILSIIYPCNGIERISMPVGLCQFY